jgi:hypothetical protein
MHQKGNKTMNMKKKLMTLAALAGFLAAAGAASAQEAKPRQQVPVKDYNAGVVQKGAKVEYAFVIKNTGKAPLQILEAKPGCGCTVAEFDKEIPPGGEGRIRAAMDTTGFAYGEQKKSINVRTNDEVEPSFILQLGAVVSAYVRVLPSDAVVFNARHGFQEEKRIVLHAEDGAVFDVTSAAADSEYLKVSYKKVTEPLLEIDPNVAARKGDYVVTIRLDAKTPVGYLAGRGVTVKTSHPKMPEVKIRVSARVSAAPAAPASPNP